MSEGLHVRIHLRVNKYKVTLGNISHLNKSNYVRSLAVVFSLAYIKWQCFLLYADVYCSNSM